MISAAGGGAKADLGPGPSGPGPDLASSPVARKARQPRGTSACSWRYEEEARATGARVVAGVDEVGRGALCGPVVAGAVILGPDFDPTGLDDSKRLTAKTRERLATRIRQSAQAWALGLAEPEEIDRVDILRATWKAMERALTALGAFPDLVLVDGRPVPSLPGVQRAIVKGDTLSYSIAAASIVAKVHRDELMRDLDRTHPGYGLGRNMGYGSALHREALRRLGPTSCHRRTFHGTQRWLF